MQMQNYDADMLAKLIAQRRPWVGILRYKRFGLHPPHVTIGLQRVENGAVTPFYLAVRPRNSHGIEDMFNAIINAKPFKQLGCKTATTVAHQAIRIPKYADVWIKMDGSIWMRSDGFHEAEFC
ncbi:hypothetical protein EVAR_53238_1 [Eumeta japonica]|uniref:Uncharacterized protein n=1 Tax=Eumeta variegata TaxID=151549 RepID=A0A4C1XDQ0_EUMVA|nr:hypothetical protein EVAR_53238_1 [Eumeta japonica]